jgi:predicted PurR-regulated permease PerM
MEKPPAVGHGAVKGRPLMPRALVILLGAASVFLIIQGIEPIQSTIASAFMALNLVLVVWPVQRALARHIPRFLASFVAGLLTIAILVALIWSIGWTIAALVQELPNYGGKFIALRDQILDFATANHIDTSWLDMTKLLESIGGLNVSTIVSALQNVFQVVSGVTGVATILMTVVMILIFMIIDSAGFAERMERLGERHNPTVAWGLSSFANGTRRYWVVTTVFGFAVALCNWVLLKALGVPMPEVWALMSFVTNFIPTIGFLIGIVPPTIMALLANDPLTALWVVIGYCVFNVVLQVFVQPKFSGDAVGITPTVAVLSLLIWAYVLGPLGTVLAIPATLFVKTMLIDIDPNARWLNALIASNPRTSDQDPERLSNLLARSKRIRKLTATVYKKGSKSEKGQAAASELATLTDDPSQGPDDSGTTQAPLN